MPTASDDSTDTTFPTLYGPWLRDIIGGAVPAEPAATCDRCVMLPTEDPAAGAVFFSPATKCCTYQPTIPNFLAGAILADSDPQLVEGRASLEQRIAGRVRVSPHGIGFNRIFALVYLNTQGVFGRAPTLSCPHLTEAGDCGIWRHRPGICAAWFCKHARGETAAAFWRRVDRLLLHIETDLAIWCASKLNAGAAAVASFDEQFERPDVTELDGVADPVRYRERWGEWAGREAAFYRACAALVEPLGWEALQQICGPRVSVLSQLVRDAYDHLASEAIPARLRVGGFQIVDTVDGKYRLVSYSHHDPLVMTKAVLGVLNYFDGRPTEDALTAILTERHVRVDPSLVRRLVDFGILKAA